MVIIQSHSHSAGFNLAAEEYLFSQRQDDILFLYVNKASVIIGCNQAILNEVDLEYCEANNICIFRRMSGGGAVFHDEGNLNFCFISRKSEVKSSLSADFLNPVLEVLVALGLPITIGKRKDLWLQGEHKISGTASHISKNREMHHGTLLYDTNLVMLQNALSPKTINESVKAIASVRSTVKNIRTYFEEQGQLILNASDFFQFLAGKFAAYFQQKRIVILSAYETKEIQQLADSKYILNEWTYKK